MESTLLSALSPQLQALVEASLGAKLPTSEKGNAATIDERSGSPVNAAKETEISIDESFDSNLDANCQLNPSELFALKHPESPGFIVKERFLGLATALAVRDALLEVAKSGEFHEAKVGAGENSRNDRAVRGDRIHWIKLPKDLKKPLDGEITCPAILNLRKQAESLVFGLKKVSPELDVRNIVSTQFAIFPGDGARFVKHLDTYSQAQRDENGVKRSDGLVRLVTCVYYLNDAWESKHGGQLRVHLKDSPQLPASHWDIPPKLDTLVVFRSLDVEHEVLPTYHKRMAVTIWFYGKPNQSAAAPLNTVSATSLSATVPPPLPDVTGNQAALADHASIFVAIPSYRDSECRHTVDDLFAKAKHPERVTVGICLQTDEAGDTRVCLEGKYPSNKVRIHWIDYRKAAGPCVARAQAQKLWQSEQYYLQIDSHMRFCEGWDCFLIGELASCPSAKPILTTYPPEYTLPNKISNDCRPTILCAASFDNNDMLRQIGKTLAKKSTSPMESLLWAAGFAFSSSQVIQEVPYDETLRFLFFGEEGSMAARLWTSGWDFFSPTKAVVYHLWTRMHRPVFQELENEETARFRAASGRYVKRLLHQENDEKEEDLAHVGAYALGTDRSFEQYQKHIGVNFSTREIEWRAQWGNLDPIHFDLTANNAGVTFSPS